MNVDNNTSKVKNAQTTGGQARITCPPTLATNIDKLKVNFWVIWADTSFLDEIDYIKNQIQTTPDLQEMPYLCPGGFNWNVQRTGTSSFSYRLTSGDITFMISNRSGKGSRANMLLDVGSESCWSPGYHEIFTRFNKWIRAIGGHILSNQISEVHLAADLVGTQINTLDISNPQTWITRSQLFTTHDNFRQLTGISIGKGQLMLRIYDKVLELRKSMSKQLTFAESWGVKNYNDTPVTRVEFQLRRPILKEIKSSATDTFGVDDFDDLCDSLQSIWVHCTHNWARHCSHKVDYLQNHQSRATLSVFWKTISELNWPGDALKTKQRPRPKKDYVALRKQFIGIGITLAAFYDVETKDLDHIIGINKHIIEEDIIGFYTDDPKEFVRRFDKKKNEVFESVSTLQNLKPTYPNADEYPIPFPNHKKRGLSYD